MEIKPMMVAIAATVVVIVVAAVLMPVLQDATTTEDTFKNAGYYDMTYTETDNLVFEWDHTDPYKVTIDGESISLPQSDFTAKTILCGDNWIVRYAYENSLKTFVQFYGNSGSQVIASVNAETDLEITCSSGSVSVTNTADPASTFSTSYTHLYVVADDGALVMKNANSPAYLNGDSEVIAMGLSKVGTTTNVGISVTGSIDDGFTWGIFRGADVTFSNQAATYTTVSDHLDLYSLEKLTATATNSTGSSDLTYSYFMVPAEVTAERTNHLTNNEIGLLMVIPTMLIIAILIGILAVVFRMRE